MTAAWFWSVFSQELRRRLSYRFDFWIHFIGDLLCRVTVAWFLWKAVFESQNHAPLGGYSFEAIVLYYVLVSLIANVVQASEWGFISNEIYQGTLTRYLVYPISFFGFKSLVQLANAFLGSIKLGLALGAYLIFFGVPQEVPIHLESILIGVLTAVLCGLLHFSMILLLEQLAFWADNVWSILAVAHFMGSLLGGGYLPLSLFPETFQKAIVWTPFPYLFSFPIRTLMGQVSMQEWMFSITSVILWSLVFWLASRWLWKKGSFQYSGVGM